MYGVRLSKGTTAWLFSISSAVFIFGFLGAWAALHRDVHHFSILWSLPVLFAPVLSAVCAAAIAKERSWPRWFDITAALLMILQGLLWGLVVMVLLIGFICAILE